MNYFFEDFTEINYRNLLKLAKSKYMVRSFSECKSDGKIIILRHDMDLSVHRALRIAEIENEESIISTFFVDIHQEFYNALEKEISTKILKILELGHKLGLHFDPTYYEVQRYGLHQVSHLIEFEKDLLERIFQAEVEAFSIHNPIVETNGLFNDYEIAGMINAYSNYFRDNFGYCSDSNGYWRHERLEEVLTEARYERLQILIHPEWWTPEPMSPFERASRCINGRSGKQYRNYEQCLQSHERKNIK